MERVIGKPAITNEQAENLKKSLEKQKIFNQPERIKQMELVYLGKKNPKRVTILKKELVFIPFKSILIPYECGKVLMTHANDIFKRLDKDARKPLTPIQAKGDGFVGDIIPKSKTEKEKLDRRDALDEQGKNIEQILDENENIDKRLDKLIYEKEKKEKQRQIELEKRLNLNLNKGEIKR